MWQPVSLTNKDRQILFMCITAKPGFPHPILQLYISPPPPLKFHAIHLNSLFFSQCFGTFSLLSKVLATTSNFASYANFTSGASTVSSNHWQKCWTAQGPGHHIIALHTSAQTEVEPFMMWTHLSGVSSSPYCTILLSKNMKQSVKDFAEVQLHFANTWLNSINCERDFGVLVGNHLCEPVVCCNCQKSQCNPRLH